MVDEQQRRHDEWRRFLRGLLAGIPGKRSAGELDLVVDLVAGVIDGIGIQAVLEPERFPAHVRHGQIFA